MNNEFRTPYRYRFWLGDSNKGIIYFNGDEFKTKQKEADFDSDVILSIEEFKEKVKGTIGITQIDGTFRV